MKVAVAWYGAEGQASYAYYVAKGHDVTIVTPQFSPDFPAPADAKVITGPDAFEKLHGFDLVIRSAGTRPDALKTDGKVWSATNEFFAECPAPIIGVTGTKGKGTTASLIASILKAAGKTVHLVGNIGVPPLDILQSIAPQDIVVYELSSFQLWDIERSPHIAVLLTIEPDHLNVHKDMDEYVAAKANIAKYQTASDTLIYHPTNTYTVAIAADSQAHKIAYATPNGGGVYVRGGQFVTDAGVICQTSNLHLVGGFNLDNACAAISAAYSFTTDAQAIAQGLSDFKGLPHRLQFVAEKGGVKYYDDSIATTPGSAIAALSSFEGPKVLILGGASKGASYDEVVRAAARDSAKIVAVGETGHAIVDLATAVGVQVEYAEGRMEKVVPVAARLADGQGVVILSPASASFDQYKNYADRGDSFVAAVNNL